MCWEHPPVRNPIPPPGVTRTKNGECKNVAHQGAFVDPEQRRRTLESQQELLRKAQAMAEHNVGTKSLFYDAAVAVHLEQLKAEGRVEAAEGTWTVPSWVLVRKRTLSFAQNVAATTVGVVLGLFLAGLVIFFVEQVRHG